MTSSPAEVTRPGGAQSPPEIAPVGDGTLELRPIAQEVARRHELEFPDELERYGGAAHEWCVHDNLYLLSWAALDLRPLTEGILERQLGWLARVLAAREYPLDRLARDLELGADVLEERAPGAREVAARLRKGAQLVRG
jgi:hypothetical protein